MRDPKTDELVNDGSDYPLPPPTTKIDPDSRLPKDSLLGDVAPVASKGTKIDRDSKPGEGSLLVAAPPAPAGKVDDDSRAPKKVRSGRRKTISSRKRRPAAARKTAGTGRSGRVPDRDGTRRATSTAPVRPASAPGQTEGTTAARGSAPARQATPGP